MVSFYPCAEWQANHLQTMQGLLQCRSEGNLWGKKVVVALPNLMVLRSILFGLHLPFACKGYVISLNSGPLSHNSSSALGIVA